MSSKQEFILELAKLKPSSTFLVLHKYMNAHGELADHNIVFHISYETALQKSLAIVKQIVPSDSYEKQARFELIESFTKSLHNAEDSSEEEEVKETYQHFLDLESGRYIKGVKMHKENGTLYLYGFCHLKRVIVPGQYREVNSSHKTIAKKGLMKLCPVSKFRQFRILPFQVESISVQHMSLLPPETV